MGLQGIGIDIVEIARFRLAKDAPFVARSFTEEEIARCFSYADPAPHLAGCFAAKEAAWKALGGPDFLFTDIEIRAGAGGAPEAWRSGRKLELQVSITHTAEIAAAIAAR